MEFAIYTYGHIDAAFNTLNAIAMITKSERWDEIIQFFSVIGLTCGVFMTAATGGAFKNYLIRLAQIIVIVNVLLTPKTHLWIVDHVSKQKEKVDNLPIGFVIPIGIIESIGNQMTKIMEQAFRSVNSFNYTDYGPTFGASLVHEMKNIRLQDPTFAHNMDQFLDRCVLTTAAIGKDFTFDDIFKSSDIWRDISPKMKNGIREVAIINSSGTKEQMGCLSATKLLEKAFRDETSLVAKLYSFTNFGLAHTGSSYRPFKMRQPTISGFFQSNLRKVFANYFGLNQRGSEILRQLLLMNAFSKYGDYGTVRAMQNQETSWQITGRLATYTIPMLLTVMKCLLYGIFPYIILSMTLSGSLKQFSGYMIFVASFQVWPAISAILSMITDAYSADNFKELSNSAVSLSSFSNVGSLADRIVGIASMLQLSVPFLSLGVVRGSFESFSHMASYIQSGITAAASASSAEVISGNRSFDNVSIGNVSGFKTDLNSSYAAGSSSYQRGDGGWETTTSTGGVITKQGVGVTESSGNIRYMIDGSFRNERMQAISHHKNLVQSIGSSLNEAQSEVISSASSIISTVADRIDKGDTDSLTDSVSNTKEYQAIMSMVNEKAKGSSVSKGELVEGATSAYFQTHAEAGGNILIASAGVRTGTDSSMRRSGSSSSSSDIHMRDSSSQTNNVSGHQGISSNQTRESHISHNLGVSNEEVARLEKALNTSRNLENRLNIEQSKLQSLENRSQKIESFGGSVSFEVTQEVLEGAGKRLGTDVNDVLNGIHSDNPAIRDNYLKAANWAYQDVRAKYAKSQGLDINIPTDSDFGNNANTIYNATSNKHKEEFNQNATSINLPDNSNVKNDIEDAQSVVKNNFDSAYTDTKNVISTQETAVNNANNETQTLFDEKRQNGIGTNWWEHNSKNFLKDNQTMEEIKRTKREKRQAETLDILKKSHMNENM